MNYKRIVENFTDKSRNRSSTSNFFQNLYQIVWSREISNLFGHHFSSLKTDIYLNPTFYVKSQYPETHKGFVMNENVRVYQIFYGWSLIG